MNTLTRRSFLRQSTSAVAATSLVAAPALAGADQHPDAELFKLGSERARLCELREPLRAEVSRLDDIARTEFKRRGHLDYSDWDAYLTVCREVGLLAAEDAREEIDEKIFPIDHKIRAIPAKTALGLKVKLDLARDYLPFDFDDVGPREDQDFHVMLFNDLADEIGRLAGDAS